MAKARIWNGTQWVSLNAATADVALNANKLGGQDPSFYAKQSDMTTAQGDITTLKASYDAHKVLTDIAGGAAGNYNANELLAALKTTTDGLTSGGSGSVADQISAAKTDLQGKIDAVKNAPIRDRVKVLGNIAADGTTVSLTTDITALLPKIEEYAPYTPYFVYDLNNKPLLDAAGKNISYNFVSGLLSGVPTQVVSVDPVTHASTRSPLALAVDFKVFPIGVFTFAELEANEDFLLDNEELNTAVYADAIDNIVVGLAQDSELIDAIKVLVGDTVVQDQIKLITDAIAARVLTLENKMGVVQGNDTIVGSIAKAAKDAADALASEVSRATTAEGVLQTNITNEATTARANEGTLATNLASEVSRAQAAEGTLTTNLTSEIARAQAAEGALSAALGTKIVIGSTSPDPLVTSLWVDTTEGI